MTRRFLLAMAFAPALAPGLLLSQVRDDTSPGQTHRLDATPKTVAWGYYDAAAPPVLRIKSGGAVEVHTLVTNSPTGLERAGVPPEQVEQALRDIHNEVTNKVPG